MQNMLRRTLVVLAALAGMVPAGVGATTLTHTPAGAPLCLSANSPTACNGGGASLTTFGIVAAIGLIVVQWLSAGLGGYVTGRLRTKWANVHTHEVFFRDTAHGFLAWGLATVFMVALFSIVASTAAVTGDVATVAPTAEAQQAAASYSLFTALSFLIGAFIASAAAAWGGYDRDEM